MKDKKQTIYGTIAGIFFFLIFCTVGTMETGRISATMGAYVSAVLLVLLVRCIYQARGFYWQKERPLPEQSPAAVERKAHV